MGFRITTNMMMNTYRYNLQGSTKKLSDARDMVLTQRTFSSYAEDPAAATLAFRLRRSYLQTSSYLSNTKDVYSKFNTAWHNLAGVVEDLSDHTARTASLRGVNDGTGEARKALAIDLRETANSVIHAMNQKLGDHFIFGGNDALNAPFSWSEDGKTLYYRGVNVNAGGVQNPSTEPTNWGAKDENGIPVNMPETAANDYERLWMNYYEELKKYNEDKAAYDEDQALPPGEQSGVEEPTPPESPADGRPGWVDEIELGSATGKGFVLDGYNTVNIDAIKDMRNVTDYADLPAADKAWIAFYNDQADLKKLQEMSGEEMYIDLGMGAAEKAPNSPVKGTYFNNALCGIDFLGYGVDEDGDPLSLPLIMRELADVFDCWDEDAEPQGYNPELAKGTAAGLSRTELGEKAMRLVDKLKAAQENTTEHWVELDANSVYLQSSETRLNTQLTDVNIQILDLEQVDLADAITTFSWEQYCYNAALKIGNQLLSQSLIDYMR